MSHFDPRLTPARADLAAEHLRGTVDAARYVCGIRQRVITPSAPLRPQPEAGASIDTELLHGEHFTVYDSREGWAWGQAQSDCYVGWMPLNALGPALQPSHKISVLRSFVYPSASIKAPPVMALSFGSLVQQTDRDGAFMQIAGGGFIFAGHAVPVYDYGHDFVDIAQTFLGVPYLWGGRSSLGTDCSGLVQTALAACGISAPRDSDMQEKSVGLAIDPQTPAGAMQRGDLLFWPGHVAMVRDHETMIHATAHTMTVTLESLAGGLERIARQGAALRTIRRICRD